MKVINLILAITVIAAAPLLAQAAYVTHNVAGSSTDDNRGPTQRILAVSPSALVEIAGYTKTTQVGSEPKIRIDFEDGTGTDIIRWPGDGQKISFTGVTKITTEANGAGDHYSITYRITTPSEDLFSGVVTLPAQVGTDWNVSLERSIDLANWTAV